MPSPRSRRRSSARFISALLEDYADEWLNKAMFHYRWTYPEDQESAAKRIVAMIFDGAEAPEGMEENVRTRMIGRLYHVGSSPETAPLDRRFVHALLVLLERCLRAISRISLAVARAWRISVWLVNWRSSIPIRRQAR
jgi:hypothetical protein